jgi:hypothetical protein
MLCVLFFFFRLFCCFDFFVFVFVFFLCPRRYFLRGIVSHCGVSLASGHFIADRLMGCDAKSLADWRRFDDSKSSTVAQKKVFADAKQQGYIFFYESAPVFKAIARAREDAREQEEAARKGDFSELGGGGGGGKKRGSPAAAAAASPPPAAATSPNRSAKKGRVSQSRLDQLRGSAFPTPKTKGPLDSVWK